MLRRRRQSSPSSRPTTVGLAGTGAMSVVHGMAAAAAGLPVTAVASRSADRAAERAGQLGARAVTLEELPSHAEAVVVATPPTTHVPLALAALDAGRTALVETPLATTLAAADELVAAEERGGQVLYGENLAFAPAVVLTRRHAGEMGALRYLEVRMLSPRPTWGDRGAAAWGGGALFDLGVHAVTLALLLAGDDRPVSVRATLASAPGLDVDDQAEVVISFASGLGARVEASWRHPEAVWDLQASSDTGVVRTGLLPAVELERDGETVAVPAPPEGTEPHVAQLGYLDQMRTLRSVAGGRPAPLGAASGRAVLDVVAAAYASAGSGGPVPLPFAGPRDATPLELWRG